MKVLSLEESKKIASQFLRHIHRFRQEDVDDYFTEKKISFFEYVKNILVFSDEPIIFSCLAYPANEWNNYAKDYYESDIVFSMFGIYDNRQKFLGVIKEVLINYNIDRLYLASEELKKNILELELNELMKGIDPFVYSEFYLFNRENNFLLINDHEEMVFLMGTNKIISDFKKKFPEYTKFLYQEDDNYTNVCFGNCKK